MVTALITLHILTMFAAVAVSQGPAFVLERAMRREDVAGIRAITAQYRVLGPLIGPTFGIGVLFGLAAVFAGGYDPLAPWLIIAYVLTVAAIATPRLLSVPRMMQVGQAAATSPAETASPELRAAIASAVGPLYWLDALILVLFIIDMVVKPFS